jgi:molecular chaperone DnaK (HSP70)
MDRWIAAHLCPEIPADGPLLGLAERMKCALSDATEARQILATPAGLRELRLTREALEGLLEERGLLRQLDGLLETVLAAARREGLAPADIDAVLPVGGSSRIPLIRRWLQGRCPGVPLRGERPVEAVAMGALALTPGVRVRDVLARGVSLRCWDRRSGRHRWHPLFLAGQSWPTEQPLELLLACSREGQDRLELVLGEPLPQERAEVVFEAGLPVLLERPAGAAPVQPWSAPPVQIPLATPGRRGVDRLRLRFRIDAEAQLLVEIQDLEAPADAVAAAPRRLGPVR